VGGRGHPLVKSAQGERAAAIFGGGAISRSLDVSRTFFLQPVDDVTQLLHAMAKGDTAAGERLIPLVYHELRQMAARRMAPGSADHTLQPTALVHEAWLRMGGDQMGGAWRSRGHFFAVAATAMRSILVDRARRRLAARHGGGQQRVDFNDLQIASDAADDDQILAVHEALEKFAAEDARKAELVKLRYFGGLSIEEAAETLGVSEPTAKRWWAYARGWLGREIKF
jgi:RNA polymerase sigma factor (TIGR02999 family)